MILCVNGSPVPNSNLRRMLDKIGKDTGLEYTVIDLVKLNIRPCTGCAKCAEDNRCIQKDDMIPLYDQIVNADALVVGGVTYFAHPNALTRTFMERMFPLRHRHPQTMGKPAAAVAVGGDEAEQTAQEIAYHLESYFNCKMVDTLFFNSATPPCFVCGYGTTCEYGGPARWMPPEEFETFTEITPDMFQKFEDYADVLAACERLSKDLQTAVGKGRD
ncbi:MAG: NAD(P)H-dependent oxidoreductase [Deltaproteobacteria bacterium]|nr:NAD(P)H-dependent oxidoreductase [Deltaproteobacteria bacterium]